MSSIVKVFDNSEIRFVQHPDGLYDFGIVAADLAVILESDSDGYRIARSVDEEWKGGHNMETPGGVQSMTVIWEPGIYQLLAKSRKPKAKPFQKWVFEEVLPSIRKTGSYAITADIPKTYGEALLEAGRLQLEKERLEAEMLILNEQNQHLAEAVDELFDYSSIIRIAKYNDVPETMFKWQVLKGMSRKMGIEVKRVPCPRFEYKLLYSHDVWRVCYPDMKMPETTTLMLPTVNV